MEKVWSNDANRLIFDIHDNKLFIASCRGFPFTEANNARSGIRPGIIRYK